MEKFYSASNLPEAYLVLHRLAQAGIDARVLNEHAQGGLGEIPFTHAYPEIWLIDPDDAARARKILKEYESVGRVLDTRTCPRCRENNPATFELCWHCGTALPER